MAVTAEKAGTDLRSEAKQFARAFLTSTHASLLAQGEGIAWQQLLSRWNLYKQFFAKIEAGDL